MLPSCEEAVVRPPRRLLLPLAIDDGSKRPSTISFQTAWVKAVVSSPLGLAKEGTPPEGACLPPPIRAIEASIGFGGGSQPGPDGFQDMIGQRGADEESWRSGKEAKIKMVATSRRGHRQSALESEHPLRRRNVARWSSV